MFKNILIKISGEALQGAKGESQDPAPMFDDSTVDRIIDEIIAVKSKGIKISLVIGGGNIWRGRSSKTNFNRAKSDQIGMLATIMNATYIAECFKLKSVNCVVMTPFIIGTFSEQFEKDKAIKYLNEGTVLIFAGGSGLPFFSTDTITAIRAAEVEAEAILFAKNVNGVYDSDPKTNKNAKKYNKMSYSEFIENDLKAIDISAMSICKDRNLTSIVFGLNENGAIEKAVSGSESDLYKIGTIISNQ